jgi:hypothetical protein
MLRFSFPSQSSVRLIVFSLIVLMITGKEYKLWSFSLCCFPHHPVIFSILGLTYFLSTSFSNVFFHSVVIQ